MKNIAFFLVCALSNVAANPYAPPFYNNEVIKLSAWVESEFRDINAQLRDRLSPSDYLEILKGEYYLLHDVPSRSHALRGRDSKGNTKRQELVHPDKLRAKLQQILDAPENEVTFARAHYIRPKEDGVFFREDLRYAEADLYWEDDLYVVGRSDNDVHVTASICDFWNARTCRKDTSFAIPTTCYLNGGGDGTPLFRLKGTAIYSAGSTHGRESYSQMWAGGTGGHYLMIPQSEKFASSYFDWMYEEDADLSRTGDVWGKISLYDEESYEKAHVSEAALPELGMKKLSERTREDIMMPYGKRTLQHADNSIIYKTKLSKGWMLDASSLRFAPYTEGGESDDLADVKSRIDSALSPYSGYHSVHAYGAVRLPWETSICTPVCGGVSAFAVEDGRGMPFGVYFSDGTVRLFPKIENLHPGRGEYRTILPSSVGTEVMEFEEEAELVKYPIIKSDTIISRVNVRYLQLTDSSDNKLHLFVQAESYSGKGSECLLLEVARDGKTFSVLRRWAYSRSRLLPYYHQSLGYVFIPASNDSYTVKKLLPDGGEQDLGSLFVNPSKGYAFVLPDGRYAGSPGCESFLGFGEGGVSVGMEALAPWRNRPADVLEMLGGNEDDIQALRKTTERWLKKLGYDPHKMPAEPKPAEFAQMDVSLPPLYAESATLQVDVELKSSARRAVTALDVRVDGVKVPQSWDADLLVPAGQSKKLTVQVPLGFGQNWVELKPVDSLGVAGAPYRFRTVYKGEYKPELYVVTLGVSDYADDGLDLQYAAKDARDVAAAFAEYSPHRVRSLTLTDAEVTPAALEKVRGFLAAATVNDCVVLYVAGHGMLNEQLEFHYAPHAFDSERVSETGISMDALRACLLDSPARKRLLLLDTCHSGSVGEEDMEKLAMNGVQLPPGVRAIQNRGMKVVKAEAGLGNKNQTRRYIEEMFSASVAEDGISVLAASSGAEFAMESGECKNGIFTTALLNTLKDATVADFNKDAKLSLGELLHYIPQQVRNMSGGLQSPSVQLEESVYHLTICLAPVTSPQAMARWIEFHKRTSPLNDLSYMRESYEQEVTNLKTGQTMSLKELMQEQLGYVSRWHKRTFDVHDYKITGNIIEIRSSYRCENTKGKISSGFCKTTYRISDNGKIDGIADDSSRERVPEFSSYAQPVGDNAPSSDLTTEKVRELVRAHLGNYSDNDLSFMRTMYEPVSTNMADGTRVDIDTMIEEHRSYITRWVKRKLELVDYAYRGNRLEIRCRFTCTNTKGKTVRGYCKTTYCYSENGLVESFADDSSTKQLPAYTDKVGYPQSL